MKNSLAACFAVVALSVSASFVAGCSKESSTSTGGAAPAAAAAPECPAVVEKIASLNPPSMRGDAEKKLWGSMCAGMNPTQRTCVMAAKAMPEMQACMGTIKLQ